MDGVVIAEWNVEIDDDDVECVGLRVERINRKVVEAALVRVPEKGLCVAVVSGAEVEAFDGDGRRRRPLDGVDEAGGLTVLE